MVTLRWTSGMILALICAIWWTGARHLALVLIAAALFLIFFWTFRRRGTHEPRPPLPDWLSTEIPDGHPDGHTEAERRYLARCITDQHGRHG